MLCPILLVDTKEVKHAYDTTLPYTSKGHSGNQQNM